MVIFNAYIDGFNLYMGALKGRPELKWLDLVAFAKPLDPICSSVKSISLPLLSQRNSLAMTPRAGKNSICVFWRIKVLLL